MRIIKRTFLSLCIAAVLIMQVNSRVSASDDILTASKIVFENKDTYSIDLIDKEREEGKIIIYTPNYGTYTKPFSENTHEFIVVNSIVVSENRNGAKGTYIPSSSYVISYTGTNTDLVKKLRIGEALTLSNLDIPALPDMYFKLNGLMIPIDQINSQRNAGGAILYHPTYGVSTKTNGWGIELTIVNNLITKIVDKTLTNEIWLDNNSTIPSDGVVISVHSGNPYYNQLHEKAKIGDGISITADNAKLYSASKTLYNAYNPSSREDNPSGWDEKNNKPYDGYRGANQMIIYDRHYGSHTGTNAYGYEVAVNNEDKIIATGGNDSEIPDGGYILSGHGDNLKWLQKNALLGSTVMLDKDKKAVIITFTPDSYINLASFSIKSAQDKLNLAKNTFADIPYENVQALIDTTESKLEHVQSQVNQGQYENLVSSVNNIQHDADQAYFMTFESVKVENRAVWLRPRETSIDEIKKHLDMLKDTNINTIYLETHFDGYAIYPTDNALVPLNPAYKGLDVLGTYIKEGHARGMAVHAWVKDFLVSQSIAEKKPEWMVVSRKGDKYFLENGVTKYYFMNPALPEVRDFISELYKTLVKNYEIDGMQFDYMRYPNSGNYSNDFGYDTYTRQLFNSYTGTDPITLKPGDTLWSKWCSFRTYMISSFAYKIFLEVKSIKPSIQISADVWPDYDKTLIDIYQDPRNWTKKDYVNTVIPMSYYLNEAPVLNDITNTWAFAEGHSQVASGIATFTKVDTKVLLRQIDAIRNSDANGLGIFEFLSLFNGAYDSALKLGAFSQSAMVANNNYEQSITFLLNDIIRKCDAIYVKYGGMNNEQTRKYKKLIEGIELGLKPDKVYRADTLRYRIKDLINIINQDESLSQEVSKRICLELKNVLNIIDASTADTRFISKHEISKFQVEFSAEALKRAKETPIKVKAVYNDNTSTYLDQLQYTVKSSHPDAVEIAGGLLRLKEKAEPSTITIEILDALNSNPIQGVSKKIEFTLNPSDSDIIAASASGLLKATNIAFTEVLLDWRHDVIDSDIVGYAIYRNDKKIASSSVDTFKDAGLNSGETYIYVIYGFDASGNTIYKSNQITVKTKAPFLLASTISEYTK